MTFHSFAAVFTFLAVPLIIMFAFTRGVSTLSGDRARRSERPASFWLHLVGRVALFTTAACLLWAQDDAGLYIFPIAALLIAAAQISFVLRTASHAGRVSGTARTAQPAAYWSAMFGMALFALLATAFALYGLSQILA